MLDPRRVNERLEAAREAGEGRDALLRMAVELIEAAEERFNWVGIYLLEGEELGAVQQAFQEHDAFQCGYCTPGQVVAVEGLLRANADPSLDEIRLGVGGNLCRCGAYANIFKAAERAAELKRGGESTTDLQ